MFYCPLCGQKLAERPYLAQSQDQTVLQCYICKFTLRTHMTYRELYASLGREPQETPPPSQKLAA